MAARALLAARTPRPTEAQVREALAGNLCRCGSHARVIRAVMRAAADALGRRGCVITRPRRSSRPAASSSSASRSATGRCPRSRRRSPTPTASSASRSHPTQVDSFLAIHADDSVTLFTGKVDLGTGGRIALRQMVAEELDIPIERLAMIEGDTALTPDQARTAGSYGIARGGMQLRHAAATARQALLGARGAAARPAGRGARGRRRRRPREGRRRVRALRRAVGDKALGLAVDPKAPLKDPQSFRFIGKSLPRPDIPAKVTGRHRYVHGREAARHAARARDPSAGRRRRRCASVDESSIARIPRRARRADRELRSPSWPSASGTRCARRARSRREWTGGTPLPITRRSSTP